MKIFEQFDELVTSHYFDDSWSDDGVIRAVNLLRTFQRADWIQLEYTWREKPADWAAKTADALSDVPAEYSRSILQSMLEFSEDREVLIQAMNSLNVLLINNPSGKQLHIDSELHKKLDALLVTESVGGKLVVRSFLNEVDVD